MKNMFELTEKELTDSNGKPLTIEEMNEKRTVKFLSTIKALRQLGGGGEDIEGERTLSSQIQSMIFISKKTLKPEFFAPVLDRLEETLVEIFPESRL